MVFYKMIKYSPAGLPLRMPANADALWIDLMELLQSANGKVNAFRSSVEDLRFCVLVPDVYLSGSPESKVQPATDLIRIFFHPAYILNANRPLLLLDNQHSNNIEWQHLVNMEALGNGFDGVDFINLLPADDINKLTFPLAVHYDKKISIAGALVDSVIRICIQERNCCASPVYLVISGSEKEELLGFILQEEELLKEKSDYKLAEHLIRSGTQIQDLKLKLDVSQMENENVSNYLKFQKDDMIRILDFYKYEYEILPRWYKQLGHIIKVITGKRTFLSLFRDDVKKYRK